jgi:prepilin-type N-terminal cleavage/methylation domain-containing protein
MKKILKGFTLIELLVVIAIIAVITSIGVANLITAQKQARDAARREIIGNVQSAFEQYYAELGSYPSTDYGAAFEGGEAPVDPKDSDVYVLSWDVSATTYCVCATLETGTGNSSNASCTWSSTGTYYCAINKQ